MFARIKRVKDSKGKIREYLLIVENQWNNGKVRQKTIANLGRMDLFKETDIADVLVDKVATYTKQKRLMDMASSSCDWSKEYGIILIFRRLWEELGLDNLFKKYLTEYRYKQDLSECILAMVISRLIDPSSEHHTAELITNIYQPSWKGLKLQHFYRALDFIHSHKHDFEKELFIKTTDLLSQKLDLIMFDTTSIKYWGEGEDIEILQRGYSKEKRGDLKQVIIGILMTKEGLPVGCEVFPGNTSDIKSFIQVIEKLKTRYDIGRLIWVADRGMVSQNNLEKLKELKQDYILGVRMRQFSKEKRKNSSL